MYYRCIIGGNCFRVKRSSGLSAVLGSINKKPKMSTLVSFSTTPFWQQTVPKKITLNMAFVFSACTITIILAYFPFLKEKSKLDWTKFKQQEGLQDELNLHNKDG